MPNFISDTIQAETSLSNGGIEAALRSQQVVYVKKNPGPGEFSSVIAALATITDASSSKRYVIQISPGEYIENNPIVTKPFVQFIGRGAPRATRILAANVNSDLFTVFENTAFSQLHLSGSTGTNACLFKYMGSVTPLSNLLNITSCYFGSCYQVIYVSSVNTDTVVYISNCLLGFGETFQKGFFSTTTGTGISVIHISNLVSDYMQASPIYVVYSTNNCVIEVYSCDFDTGPITGGICFQADNGGNLEILSCIVKGFGKAIYSINTGVSPEIKALGNDFEGNTIDMQIDHVSTLGFFNGAAQFSKIVNSSPNTFSISYMDPSVGDFNISRTAHMRGYATDITSVTSASQTKQLLHTDAHAVVVTGSTNGQIIILPNATTLRKGHQFWVINSATVPITVSEFGGTNAIVLFTSNSVRYILEDNITSSGVWYRAISSSSPFQGTSPLVVGYGGNAVATRYLEFVSGNSSDNSPFIIISPASIVGLSLGGIGTTTCILSIFKNGNFITPIATLTVSASNNVYNNNLNAPLALGDLITAAITSGSINKPFAVIYMLGS